MTRPLVVDFTPGEVDLVLWEGDGDAMVYNFKDTVTGAPVNVSAGVWAATWKPAKGASQSVALDLDTSGAATGVLVVHSTAVTSRAIAAISRTGVWDLQRTLPASDPQTYLAGKVTVKQDITP